MKLSAETFLEEIGLVVLKTEELHFEEDPQAYENFEASVASIFYSEL